MWPPARPAVAAARSVVRTLNCLCGARVEAGDASSLAEAYIRHTGAEHPQVQLSDDRRAELVDRVRRTGGWDGERRPLPDDVAFRALQPSLADEYLEYFDTDAFRDNPAWAGCYCLSYEIDIEPLAFEDRTAADNRAEKRESIISGRAGGVLAYAGGRIAGWCNAQPRSGLPLLDRTPGFETVDPERPGAIVCFVIAPQYRGQGLASRLLDAGCDALRERGCTSVESFPPRDPKSDAGAYHGSRKMYEAAGFEHVRDSKHHAVMRKRL